MPTPSRVGEFCHRPRVQRSWLPERLTRGLALLAGFCAGVPPVPLLPVPPCPECGTVLKPDVVFFGELLPEEAIDRAVELARSAGVLLVAGSSLEVYPVAGLPEETLAAGGRLAIVNRGPTPFDGRADVRIDASAGETLRALARALGG